MDEASARSLLTQMQARISRDPYEALGVGTASRPADIRSAFLALTKKFHPAKFARMAPDVQKLANEVFLALRGAHDTLTRPAVSVKQTGSVPIVRAPPSRPSTPPATVPASAGARPPTQPVPITRPPSAARTPTGPRPVVQGTTQPITRPVVAPSNGTPRPVTTPSGTGPRQIPPGARTPGSTPPATRSATGPRPVIRSTNPPVGAASGGGADREIGAILALLDVGQFAAAKVAVESLVARAPTSNRFKAMVHYVNAREAQAANKPEEARGELLDALQIDPTFELANTALATLFAKRK